MSLAHSFPVAIVEAPVSFNQDIKAFVPHARVSGEFLLRWLEANQAAILLVATEATHGTKRIPTNDLLGRCIPLPQPAEQRAIAETLSDVDGLLGALEGLIAKKRAIKKVAMQHLLTGKTRLPGFNEKWKGTRVGDIADVLKGSGLSKEQLSQSGTRPCILYGELFTRYGRTITEVVSRTESFDGVLSLRGDTLMPSSTTTVGSDLAIASALLEDGVALGGDINILRRRESAYDSAFFASYLTIARREQIAALTQGITIHHLYGRDLKKMGHQGFVWVEARASG